MLNPLKVCAGRDHLTASESTWAMWAWEGTLLGHDDDNRTAHRQKEVEGTLQCALACLALRFTPAGEQVRISMARNYLNSDCLLIQIMTPR